MRKDAPRRGLRSLPACDRVLRERARIPPPGVFPCHKSTAAIARRTSAPDRRINSARGNAARDAAPHKNARSSPTYLSRRAGRACRQRIINKSAGIESPDRERDAPDDAGIGAINKIPCPSIPQFAERRPTRRYSFEFPRFTRRDEDFVTLPSTCSAIIFQSRRLLPSLPPPANRTRV